MRTWWRLRVAVSGTRSPNYGAAPADRADGDLPAFGVAGLASDAVQEASVLAMTSLDRLRRRSVWRLAVRPTSDSQIYKVVHLVDRRPARPRQMRQHGRPVGTAFSPDGKSR
jgi:hypothetical protein